MTSKITPATAAFNAKCPDQGFTVVLTPSAHRGTQLSPDALRNFDFDLCNECTYFSWSPKAAFDAREAGEIGQSGEYETLYDYLTQPHYTGHAADTLLEVSQRLLPRADVLMKVYRAADKTCGADYGVILPGASVTESEAYAKRHADLYLDGNHKLMETTVFPDELVTHGNPHEFTYVPRSLTAGCERYAADLARTKTTV